VVKRQKRARREWPGFLLLGENQKKSLPMRVSCIFAARKIGLDVKTTTIAAESGECDDDYPGIIARLNDGWRIVAAPDGTQWVLQRQRGAHRSADDWRARAYCRMRHARGIAWRST
jgi:hypothetical protein